MEFRNDEKSSTPTVEVSAPPNAPPKASPTAPLNVSPNAPPNVGWLVADYPVLTGKVGQAAVNGQIVFYPEVVRSQRDEPIDTQNFGLVSFMILKEPQVTKDGKKIAGFFKIRGNYGDENLAIAKGSKIVREQDSKYKIRVANVGAWIPLLDDDSMVKRNVNINVEVDEQTDIAKRKADEEKENERKRIERELREREDEVKNGKDYNDDPASLDYYTMKMIVWRSLSENVVLEEKKLANLKSKLTMVRELLGKLDEEHPEHEGRWLDNYNKGRNKAGVPNYIPSESELERYRAWRPKVDTGINIAE